jgi:hypothetical protein
MSNPFFKSQNSEQAYGRGGGGGGHGGGGGGHGGGGGGRGGGGWSGGGGRHGGGGWSGGGRNWSGGGWSGRNWNNWGWNGGYYPYSYYYYPYDYYYPYSYYYPYNTTYYVDTPAVTTTNQQNSSFGTCACPTAGSKGFTDFCAVGYQPSCQSGSCACVNSNQQRALLGDWGCGNNSQAYCPKL